MKPIKGLLQDLRPENQPEGTYPFGKNGIQFDLKGSVTNEKGFLKLNANIIPPGYTVNGMLETDTSKVIIFYTNNIDSGIKLYDVDTDTVSFHFIDTTTTYKLGFKAENYITGQIQRNYLGELVCAFTDKNTFPKYINLDNPVTTYLKDWNLYPECTYPTVSESIQVGGILTTGSYFYAIRYYKQDGTRTSFSNVSQGVVVTTSDGTQVADKMIKLVITNMDQSYDFLEVAIIARVDGVTSSYLLTKVPVVPGSFTINFTGDGVYEDIALDEILVPSISYDKVGTMGQLNDALYVAKLSKTRTVTDMQPYANLVKIEWVSELLDVTNCPDDHKAGIKKTFKHQEVYALYIRYKLTNGEFSTAYTIPGVELTAADLANSTIASAGGSNALVYECEDSITSTGTYTGLTGPYQNKTELYPDTPEFDSTSIGGPNLRNKPVRHHKMPSVKYCKANLYSGVPEYGVKYLDLLGIRASNVIIPNKYADLIDGYEILYAKRTLDNMLIYGQSLLLQSVKLTNSAGSSLNSKVYSVGHNFEAHPNGSSEYFKLDYNHARFHGFDYLFNKPTIKPAFISSQLLLRGALKGSYSAFATTSGGSAYTGNCVHLVDMTEGTGYSAPANNIRNIQESKHLEHNINNGDYYNNYLESALGMKLTGTTFNLSVAPIDYLVSNTHGNFTGSNAIEAHLVDLCDIKSDIYNNFYTQELVSAGNPKPLSTTDIFFGGDCFLSLYTFHTYGYAESHWQNYYDHNSKQAYPENRGRRIVNRIICETVGNLWTRYEIAGNIYSKWYSHNFLSLYPGVLDYTNSYPASYNGFEDPNQFGYIRGSEGINDFVQSDIYNPYREYQTEFPYRIHRGGKLSRYNKRSWRTFLPLDYYEIQKNMGFIQHVEGMEDRLLIHCDNALFITQDKGKLEGGNLTVTLGTGDIFQFEPQEVQAAKLGYAGTQHDLACVKTPIGYIFADSKQGELYLYKGKELKALNTGLHRFLRDYLRIKGKNSFNGNGITIGWDQRYKRMITTVKNKRPADGTNVVVLNSPTDITDVIGVVGPPLYPDCLQTTNGLVKIGDVIFYNGKYLRYLGQNTSIYDCPADPCDCTTPYSLAVSLLGDQVSSHVSWAGVGPFQWTLSEITTTGAVLLQTGGTIGYFEDFTTPLLGEDKTYKFEIWSVCSRECLSLTNSVQWTTSHQNTDPADYCLWYEIVTIDDTQVDITITLKDNLGNPVVTPSDLAITFYRQNSSNVVVQTYNWTILAGNYSISGNSSWSAGDYLAAGTGYLGTIGDPNYCGFGTYIPFEPVEVAYKFYVNTNVGFPTPMLGVTDFITISVLSGTTTYYGSCSINSTFPNATVIITMPAPSGSVVVGAAHVLVGATIVSELGTGTITLSPTSLNNITITYT